MQRKFLRFILAGLACVFLLNLGCTKIDTTELGADLIPAVDNVSTFADTFDINAAREQIVDTTKLSRSETHVLGSINNDPVFGKTKADIFVQLKPSFFPFYFGNAKDTINPAINSKTHFDSAFLCLSVAGFYGDSTKAQNFKVYQLAENTRNFIDSVSNYLSFQPDQPYQGNLIGEKNNVYLPDVRKLTYLNTSKKDSVTMQIRIKLSNAFLTALVGRDSAAANSNNLFYKDSLFKEVYKGFAVTSNGGSDANGLFYINLAEANTRLEVHYVAGNANVLDTAFTSLPLSLGTLSTVSASANANSIVRFDTSAAEFTGHPDANALYIQSAPGSAINLKIPELSSLTNRIIHRAEIFLEQIPGSAGDAVLTAPPYLYLDIIDSAKKIYKPLYFDLSPAEFYNPDDTSVFFPSQGIDYNYYGGFLRTMTDGLGTRSYYTFNLTRYVQNLATNGGTNYAFRVYAPYNLHYYGLSLSYKNSLGFGRVKIGSGTNASYKLRMRVVWSRL